MSTLFSSRNKENIKQTRTVSNKLNGKGVEKIKYPKLKLTNTYEYVIFILNRLNLIQVR